MDINTIIASIGGVITAVITVATGSVIPLLKAKQGTEKVKQEAEKFKGYVAMAEKAVSAAEQIASLDTGEKMKSYVESFLKSVGVPYGMIQTVHEAAVLTLKAGGVITKSLDAAEAAIEKAIGENRANDVASDDTADEAQDTTNGAGVSTDTTIPETVTEDTQEVTVTTDATTEPTGQTITVSDEVYAALKILGVEV
jgi:hypothetical protein